jgi:hypothetical protein
MRLDVRSVERPRSPTRFERTDATTRCHMAHGSLWNTQALCYVVDAQDARFGF